MKNFDLNACGVQEMNAAEVAEVNGGFNDYMDVNLNNHHGSYGGGSTGGSKNNGNFGLFVWFLCQMNHAMN